VGLAVLITPWNFPLAMATRKIAPALAAGCAAVIKPATLTPLTTIYAVELARQAGVPADLVQVVTTSSSSKFSEAVLRDERVRKVSFTGSTEVGRTLMRLASDTVLRSSMELGGNAPFLVFDDADLERAIDGAFAAKLRNGGQSCIGANRFYVQDGIADAFAEGLAERFRGIAVGAGLGQGTVLGPLIDDRAVRQMRALTDDAVAHGAELLAGGTELGAAGHFFAPTVLDRVAPGSDIARTEIFGPIAAIQRFSTEAEAIERANDTEFGLAGYVFSESLDRALNVADRLETGIVGINQGVPSNAAAPFGGVKQSGVGREGSAEGIEEYQSVRFYNIARRETH
jgi:succinate-semialdehyde dehydrogenase/glutarate-semialdehyde dehydrogenase